MLYNEYAEENGAVFPRASKESDVHRLRKGDTVREYARVKYKSDLADRMLCFFEEYDEGFGAPSFAKFARSLGITVAHLEGYRKHKKFDIAYRECSEIRKDYLIDMALDKRFDPTFVRHLIANEKDGVTGESLDSITVRVIE